MENLKKVTRAQWCLFVLLIGFAFLMQNCNEDDATIFEENQTETELNAKPVKVTVCRFNERKGTYSEVTLLEKRLQPGDVIIDADGDGYAAQNECNMLNGLDCDDTNAAITVKATYYRDIDEDGYGDLSNYIENSCPEPGYVTDNTDCDDNDSTINPGAVEICGDIKDNDCDGETDEEGCVEKTYVPDDNFEQALIALSHDDVLDGYVLTANINTITSLDVSSKSISDLTGVEDFAALLSLKCNNNNLTSIDVSENLVLRGLECNNNKLTSLDVSKNTDLWILYCGVNPINSLDVSKNEELRELRCNNNGLTNLDVSFNLYLNTLICDYNSLESLNLINNDALVSLLINNNSLTNLDVSNNTVLNYLNCQSNPNLYCIQVTQHHIDTHISVWSKDSTAIYSLDCSSN